ncbi:Arginine biosynthesis bifunctional protein ArgJ [wastewater metagenome]|uniref:Arginine biosynthesis bifunctional protein ArgJ n=4 Tax=root TaxID=1 RepID=A0A5B8RAP6_9ZZZZ|nr:arginine biosynthesis bifunctional protein ArgJ [uncultured organism]
MAVGNDALPVLHPVPGVRLAATAAGVSKPNRRDLALIELAPGGNAAAVFTENRFRAAPVVLAAANLATTAPRYLLVNTGNANAGTGERGHADARRCCEALASLVDCTPEAVLPYSTGVIGEPLPVGRIEAGLPALVDGLRADAWGDAAEAILTTDTRPKGASERVQVDGRTVTLTGIAKGSGMIRPNMATMLAFLATDAVIEPAVVQRLLGDAVAGSFNRITVDGDTSTNDACTLIASGNSAARIDPDTDPEGYQRFRAALSRVCESLARAIVRDGEGATREIAVTVRGARDDDEAARVAFAVAESPLVKTAVFAGDPNWGRILAAVGRAGVDDLDVTRVRVDLADYTIADGGGRVEDYEEAEAARRMAADELPVTIDLRRGKAGTTVWSCDFSYEYVRINADYRS